jgi:hypothetical protein
LPEDKAFEMVDLATPASLAACPRERYMWFPIVRMGYLETISRNI